RPPLTQTHKTPAPGFGWVRGSFVISATPRNRTVSWASLRCWHVPGGTCQSAVTAARWGRYLSSASPWQTPMGIRVFPATVDNLWAAQVWGLSKNRLGKRIGARRLEGATRPMLDTCAELGTVART